MNTIEWAIESLISHGYALKNSTPEEIQNTPWSSVFRFETDKESIYLKQTPPLIAIEADVIQLLQNQFNLSVPKIISRNRELNCFLMHDAGHKLRDILKKQFDVKLVCKAVEQFIEMQLKTADHVDLFIQLGVPDWRLDKMTFLFDEFLLQKNILIGEGLSEQEIEELKKLSPKIKELCQQLSSYPIKQTIVQPDFNDNNMLINTNHEMTLIDLGEIAISHPFFSHLNFLFIMQKHHGLKETDPDYQLTKDICLKKFNTMPEAFEIAKKLWFVYGVFAHYRLMIACGVENVWRFQQGKLGGMLKEMLILMRC